MDVKHNKSRSIDSFGSCEPATVAKALRQGIEIRDRKWRTKTYRQCFLHSEAVRWTEQNRNLTEERSVALLNEVRLAGYVQHVVDPHKPFKVGLGCKKLYFCFVDDGESHVQQHPNKETAKFLRQNQMTRGIIKEVWQNSEESRALLTRLNRMASSITKLSEAQRSNETKLEIVHQCTISLVQTMVLTGILLFVFSLFVLVPALHHYMKQNKNEVMEMGELFIMATLALCTGLFVAQGRCLFYVWLSLDTCVIRATERDTAVDYYEITSKTATTAPPRRGIGRRTSSMFLKEAILHRTSQLQSMLSFAHLHSDSFISKIQQRQAADLPDPSLWPHRPVCVVVNSPVSSNLDVEPAYGTGPCPIGKPFSFSSQLFEGQCLIRLRDIPNSDNPAGDEAYFAGRRRLFQTIVQGRFKECLPVSNVLTGHEFIKPLQNLPHPWILRAATNVISKLAPGADIQVLGNNPTMLAPLAATSQVVRGDEPGNETDIATIDDILEDCSLLGGKFTSGNVTARGRKLHLSNPQQAEMYMFDTETVYTFDFYQSLLNVGTYSLDMGVANIFLSPILNGQPIQALCKTTDGRYLWSFQLWHESLLTSIT